MKAGKRPLLTDAQRAYRLRDDLRTAAARRAVVQPAADAHAAGLRAVRDRLQVFHAARPIVASEMDRRQCLAMHDDILEISIRWGRDARECRELSTIIDQLTRELGELPDVPDDLPAASNEEEIMASAQTQAPPPAPHEIVGAIAAMIQTVDERAKDASRRWGFNRLPHLVPFEWLDRFRSQKRKWETACFECSGSPKPEDIETVRKHGEAMLRAFDKLDTLAVEAGYLPTSPSWWEFELKDGTPVLLVRDRAEIGQVDPQGRACQIWSLEEVAEIVAKFPLIAAAKEAFPGAEVVQMRTSRIVTDALDDSLEGIPF